MDTLGPQRSSDVLATCQQSAPQISQAFSRAFNLPLELTVGEPDAFSAGSPPADCTGPGLVVLLPVGRQGAVLLFGESTGLLPKWYNQPKATDLGRLATLAQDLGKLMLPSDLQPGDCAAAAVADMVFALRRGACADGAGRISLTLRGLIGGPEPISLIWPIENPSELFDPQATSAESAGTPQTDDLLQLKSLPQYSRSLLRIRVPVMVTLAAKKQPVAQIVELVPGSIIQFNKSCDEMLEIELGSQRIAQGECVKVGDKFGLRITSLILPAERFQSVTPISS